MNATAMKFTLDSSCQCKHCVPCGMGYMGDSETCDECGSQLEYLYDGCGGLCWDDAVEAGEYCVEEYLTHWDKPQHLRIEGRAMGWQRLAGHKDIPATWEAIREALSLDRSDFRIDFTIEGDIFSARRYSHDEPVGASFSIYPVKLLPDTMTIDEAVERGLLDEYGCHKGCGEYFYDCRCESEGESK